MSVYSLDSLENEPFPSSRDSSPPESIARFTGYASTNETADELSTRNSKNAIIAREDDARSWSQWHRSKSEVSRSSTSVSTGRSPPSSFRGFVRMRGRSASVIRKEIPASVAGTSPQRTFHNERCIPRKPAVDTRITVAQPSKESQKHDKTSAPGVRTQLRRSRSRRPTSYMELYCRKLSVERPRRLSQGNSLLSICGDSFDERHRELLEVSAEVEEASPRCASTSRDDQSEISFYRHVLETRRLARDDLSRRKLQQQQQQQQQPPVRVFRPYTLQDYQCMSASVVLDRSLGPDRENLIPKKEGLVRRRSYGDSASALNRHKILLAVKKHRTRGEGESSQRSCTSEVTALAEIAKEDLPSKETTGEAENEPAVKDEGNRNQSGSTGRRTPSITRTRATQRSEFPKKSKPAKPPDQKSGIRSGDDQRMLKLIELRIRHFQEKQMVSQLVTPLMLG